MTKHVRLSSLNTSVSRRQVMAGSAGLTFAVALAGKAARAASLASERAGKALSPWVSIAPDGTITIMSAATEPSVVVHAASGRRLSYGEIAAFAEIPDKAPEIKPAQLKKTSQFRLIGKDVMRVELPGKVDGSAQYAIDVQVSGMLYGAVLRAPVEGAAPDKIDEAKARAIAGVIKIIRMP